MDKTAVIKRQPDILFSEVDDEVILMSTESGLYFSLNEMGSYIWNRIGEGIVIVDLLAGLVANYDISIELCEAEVLAYLEKLDDAKAICIET